METNFESRRSGAHCVAQVDMCCLGYQTIVSGGVFLFALGLLGKTHHKFSNETLVFFAVLAVLSTIFIVIDFIAINRLLKASRENNEIGTEKALAWTRFWFNLSLIYLLIGILTKLVPFKAENFVVMAIGVMIRVYMLATVKQYMNALEKRLLPSPGLNVESELRTAYGEAEYQDCVV